MPFTHGGPRIYHERHGEGEPLLWITGFGLSSAIFEPLLDHYTGRFDCVLYDNRGAATGSGPMRRISDFAAATTRSRS